MRLNKTTSHALRVLIACARPDDGLRKVADLAGELGLTEQNVFKMVHLLSRAGLVAAERGRHGGVRLARPAEAIRVGDVVIAMETVPQSEPLSGGDDDTPVLSRPAGTLFDHAFEAFLAVLNQSTVADMARAQEAASRHRARPGRKAAPKAKATLRSEKLRTVPPRATMAKPRGPARGRPAT